MSLTGRLNSIYRHIKVNYNADALCQARRLEQISLSHVRQKQHLRYLHLCKEQEQLPRFLLSKPPIDHPKAWNIARKSGWAYLRLLISNCHHKLKTIRKESATLVEALQDIVTDTCLSSLHQAISSRCSHLQNVVEERHQKKFHQLVQNHNSNDIQKKWVINISGRKLNDNEVSLLRKGLNYVSTPKVIPRKEILASVEQDIENLSKETKNEVRINMYSVLKQARPPAKQNLTRGEKKALKDLKSDETIIVTKADKGNSVVVINRTNYQNQVTKMLEDKTVYKRIIDKRRNPTTKTELELEKILKDLKRSENLTETTHPPTH